MRYPLVIEENGNIFLIKSELSAKQYLEPIDVKNMEYIAYDSDGLVINLEVVKSKKKLGRVVDEIVISQADSIQHKGTLLELLKYFLKKLNVEIPNEENISLDDLIKIVSKHTDVI